MLSLEQLCPGETAIIDEVKSNGVDHRDLMEMGLTAGTPVELVKFAPLGDPLEIRVRDYHLTLRKSDAHSVLVTKR